MAEDANRDDRVNQRGTTSEHNGSQTPLTLSQLEQTEKPADFTVADLASDQKANGVATSQNGHPSSGSSASANHTTAGSTQQTSHRSHLTPAEASANSARSTRATTANARATHPHSRTRTPEATPRTQSFPRQESRPQTSQREEPVRRSRVPRARRMKLSVTKISPWSVAKVTFMLSIAMGIIQTICAAILYAIVDAAGVFDKISSLVSQTGLAGNFNMSSILGMGQVISVVVIFSVFEVVILVFLSVIFAFLYNVVSSLVGGIHVTLGDD